MTWIHVELFLIIVAAAVACALPGIFLVLRGIALMSDAMSHAMLLGIVGMFLIVRHLYSPLLLLGAALAGLATVFCTEALIHSKCLKKDTAIGLVFPLFFSIGIILINLYARDVHLDTDMVLLGELALAPFHRLIIGDVDWGPYALWQLGFIVVINAIVLYAFFKELAVATFDPEYAAVIGFSPSFIHHMLMVLTSITVVAAFDAVGAIVVVALMIAPAATASLMTKELTRLIYLAIACSMGMAIGGYLFASMADVSIAGSIAMMAGVQFTVVFGWSKIS
jgi:manganese/zinc/iron transport system permease protein